MSLAASRPFAVARIIEHSGQADGLKRGQRVLVGCPNLFDAEFDAAPDASLPIDDDLATVDALLIPHTARALRIWRILELEIGEAAVYTVGTGSGQLVALLASWRCALPVIRLALGTQRDEPVHSVSGADPAAAEQLRALIADAPGVAAVDTTGSGNLIGILLDALPRWGRLMLAGPILGPFATDFYTDIHRKGLKVCSGPDDAASGLVDLPGWNDDFDRARRLLMEASRAAQLRACAYTPSVDQTGPGPAI